MRLATMNWHVEPVNDWKPHLTSGEFCKCEPRVEVQSNGNKVVVHNAWDGREFFENEVTEYGIRTGNSDAGRGYFAH